MTLDLPDFIDFIDFVLLGAELKLGEELGAPLGTELGAELKLGEELGTLLGLTLGAADLPDLLDLVLRSRTAFDGQKRAEKQLLDALENHGPTKLLFLSKNLPPRHRSIG